MAERIGFIGLGKMGHGMACNLLKSGYALTVYDVDEGPVSALEAVGAARGASPREVASGSDVVITMLPSPAEVEVVAMGAAGIREGLARGGVYIDMSTTGPATTRRIARAMAEAGVAMLDAPVSRGQEGARAGTLSIMVGGDQAAFARVEPVLRCMGTDVFYCGVTGMGAATKLVNNLIQGTISGIVAEGLVLGVKAGIALPILLQVLGASSADNFVLRHFFPNKALRGDFEPGGTVYTVHKDLGLAIELGDELQVPLALGALAHRLYGTLTRKGQGDRDFTALITLIEEAAGVTARLPG
jgi:3-hydroxyisobutyrate dehydrogenase